MGKKIAFIGSSGGNLYKQGGNDLPAMMKELCGQTKAADMEIVFVQYVTYTIRQYLLYPSAMQLPWEIRISV